MALRAIASTPAACNRPSTSRSASCGIAVRPSILAGPVTAAVNHLPTRAYATAAFAPAKDFRIGDDALMNCDEQKQGFCAASSASFEGTDDSDLMSAPVDLPREEAEVFFSEEKLHQDEAAPGAHVDNPTERASEGQQQGGQPEERSAGGGHEPDQGRFDEEAVPGDKPYSPTPKDRGHGIPPHKDDSNTTPGPMSSPEGGSSSGQQHPSGDEQSPAAAI